MKQSFIIVIIAITFGISACSKSGSGAAKSDDQILKQIWRDYHSIPGNQGADDRNEKGRIVKRGTVPPSAMNSSVQGRLPAYLACYDFLMVTSFGDSNADMCIYYISNPSIGRSSMQWRGKEYISQLEQFMRNDGFVEGK
jgi:hypothetical protein